jgi:hypothetical protein
MGSCIRCNPAAARSKAREQEQLAEDAEEEAAEGEEEEEGEDEEPLEQLSTACHVITEDGFLPAPLARQLRGTFDGRFAEPRSNSPERFMWDYWYVPDQYCLVRTQVSECYTHTHAHIYTQIYHAMRSL